MAAALRELEQDASSLVKSGDDERTDLLTRLESERAATLKALERAKHDKELARRLASEQADKHLRETVERLQYAADEALQAEKEAHDESKAELKLAISREESKKRRRHSRGERQARTLVLTLEPDASPAPNLGFSSGPNSPVQLSPRAGPQAPPLIAIQSILLH